MSDAHSDGRPPGADPSPLSNASAPYQPDADDLIWLNDVVLGLARVVAVLASPAIEAGAEAVMDSTTPAAADAETIDVLRHTRRRLDLADRLAAAVLGDVVSLDRTERNDLRSIAHMTLGAAWAPQEPTRIPERLLEALGPWFEEGPPVDR